MILLRSGLFQILFVLSIIPYGAILGLFGPVLPYRVTAGLGRNWALLVLWLLRVICRVRYQIEGLAHLSGNGGLILCKHQSTWETVAIRALFPLHQTWVLKQELMRVPFFGWALMSFEPIAIDRSAGRQAIRQLLDEGRRWLDAGRWVVIFPEGTRVAAGQRHQYNIGGALLAERSGRPVIPVAHNAGIHWPRRSLRVFPGTIQMIVGEPISAQGRRASDINQDVENWIEGVVTRLPHTVD